MKKFFYILFSVFLGLLLSLLLHGILEIVYIKSVLARGGVLDSHYLFKGAYCVLPIWLQILIILTGIIGGYFLGQYWWRIVYIEKKHWRFRKEK